MAVRLSARCSEEANKWLDKRSEELGVSKAGLVSIAIENMMKEETAVKGMPSILEKLKELEG